MSNALITFAIGVWLLSAAIVTDKPGYVFTLRIAPLVVGWMLVWSSVGQLFGGAP